VTEVIVMAEADTDSPVAMADVKAEACAVPKVAVE